MHASYWLAAWRRVSGVRRMNEVNARRARLVPGWVTVFGRVYQHVIPCGMSVPVAAWQPCELLCTCYLLTYQDA